MGTLKSKILLKFCPDCKQLLPFNANFKVYIHAISSKCAYIESLDGKRLFDDKMKDEIKRANQEKAFFKNKYMQIIEEQLSRHAGSAKKEEDEGKDIY